MFELGRILRRLNNALRYLWRGDISGLVSRFKSYSRDHSQQRLYRKISNGSGAVWGIMCIPHTLFVAQAIAERLAQHGIESEIILGPVEEFNHDLYIVLCAQTFKNLPPADKRFIFQLEQSVSSRWFTPEYMQALKDSIGVIEYSLKNIEFLAKEGLSYPNVYYLPIGAMQNAFDVSLVGEKKYDFVFYGDSLSSERRRKFLERLQEKYSVKICNDLFGPELYRVIREARAVINIHYYQGALLEMPRICECISLGMPILSEGTGDQAEYPELDGTVRFFEEGSLDGMMAAADVLMSDLEPVVDGVSATVATSSARFNFMMDRFLVAVGAVTADKIFEQPVYIAKDSDFFALSLPETIARRKSLTKDLPAGCVVFDGIRNRLSWIGCGCSFSALSRYALASGLEQLTIMEDDAQLPDNVPAVLSEVKEYLVSRAEGWDIFCGLIADLHASAEVLSVETVRGRRYVTIDKMTSGVFNIYNKSALELLSQWDPLNEDSMTNTFDRFIEQQDNLRVVVALPFVAGHKEEVTSTLWGFDNDRYSPMIAEAERKITKLADEWQSAHQSKICS